CTTSSTSNSFSTNIPSTSLGTSLSTLSVAISSTASSTSIVSPTSLSQVVTVASATLSPIFGNFNSNLAIFSVKNHLCFCFTKLMNFCYFFILFLIIIQLLG